MAIPKELAAEVTVSASARNALIGYTIGQYVLRPWEDTVAIRLGGPSAFYIYDELLRDGRVFGAFRKRVKETTRWPYEVVSASDDQADTRAAEIVKAQLDALNFDQYQKCKMGALMKGLSIGEILWREPTSRRERERLGSVIAHSVAFRHPAHFRFTAQNDASGDGAESELPQPRHLHYVGRGGLYGSINMTGTDLDVNYPRKFVRYAWGSEYNDPYGKGLGHQLYWLVFFKREDWKMWLYYADKFGMPTTEITYNTDPKKGAFVDPASAEGKQYIKDAKTEGSKIRTESTLIHSDAFVFEFMEPSRRGDVKTYTELLNYCDREISITITGSTLTLDLQGQGARAATETHQEDLGALGHDDAEQVCADDSMSIVRWISELNVPDATPPTVRRVFPDQTDYQGMAETHLKAMTAVEKGLNVDFAEKAYKIVIDPERVKNGADASGGEQD